MADDDLLTVKELAAYLGVKAPTIYTWNSSGKGPKITRVGTGRGSVRYRKRDVEAWIEARNLAAA